MQSLRKLLLIITLFSLFSPVDGQFVDTVFWNDNLGLKGIEKLRFINYHMGDTVRVVEYWKGKVISVKYQTRIKACIVPILTDTVYSEYDRTNYNTILHKTVNLANSGNCDSLIKIHYFSAYKNGEQLMTGSYKYVGSYGKCPCGTWKYFNPETRIQKYLPCESKEIDNISLTKTYWRPDSSCYVELFKEDLPFAMPGQGSDHSATLVLKNRSGKVVRVVSSESSESVLHRSVHGISWLPSRNMLSYGPGKYIEWIDEDRLDLNLYKDIISRFLGTNAWTYFKNPAAYGSSCFIIGYFDDENEYDKTLDMAVLVQDANKKVDLLLIKNYNYPGQEQLTFIDIQDEYSWVGNFRAVRKGSALWSNWIETGDDEGFREFDEVPQNEIIYLPYDAIFVHAGESCGGGFIFWNNNQWNWLQQE